MHEELHENIFYRTSCDHILMRLTRKVSNLMFSNAFEKPRCEFICRNIDKKKIAAKVN